MPLVDRSSMCVGLGSRLFESLGPKRLQVAMEAAVRESLISVKRPVATGCGLTG